jgi:hypothetical protein
MQPQIRHTEPGRLPAESSDPSFDPASGPGTPSTPGPCPAYHIFDVARAGTELGDRRQTAQQTSMIASRA